MPENPEMNLANAVKILYQSKFKPIYLLFDQFEELLILGKEPEKVQFFEELQQLLETKTPCRVILILREEFIGHLSEYENLVPSLFRHRFRVEKMNKTKVAQVIEHTLQAAAKFEPPFDVQDSNKLTQAILNNLPDDSREIELVHLQVYLDKLWKRDYQHAQSAKRPVCLTAALIAKEDKLQRILGEFLEEQLSLLTQNDKRLLPLELLISMITQEGTKLQRTEHEIIQRLTHNEIDFATSEIPPIIQHLVQNRILRVLKAGDITRYELSHDLLAQIVKSMLTQEMELREKATDIYAVYQEREGFFSQEDLDYMRPYQVYKNYPADLEKRIRESERYIIQKEEEELNRAILTINKEKQLRKEAEISKDRANKQEKIAKKRSYIAFLIAIIAIGVSIFATWEYFDIKEKEKNIELATKIKYASSLATEALSYSKEGELDNALCYAKNAIKKDVTNVHAWRIIHDYLSMQKDSSVYLSYSTISHKGASIFVKAYIDNQHVLAYEKDTIKIINIESKKCEKMIKTDKDLYLSHINFSPNKKYIITSNQDTTAKIWEVATGKLIQTLIGHKKLIYYANFSSDGKYMITSSFDKTAKIWEFSTGKLIKTLIGHTKLLDYADFSPSGKYIYTNSDDKTTIIWDFYTGKIIRKFKHKKYVNSHCISFSPDEKHIIINLGNNKMVTIWDINTGKIVQTTKEYISPVDNVKYALDGKYLNIVFDNAMVMTWDIQNQRYIHKFKLHEKEVLFSNFSFDAQKLVIDYEGKLKVYDLTNFNFYIEKIGFDISYYSIYDFCPVKNYFANEIDNDTIAIFQINKKEPIAQFKNKSYFNKSIFSPNGKYFAMACSNMIKILNIETMELDTTSIISKEHSYADFIKFSSNEKYLVFSTYDSICIFDLEKKYIIQKIEDKLSVKDILFTANKIYTLNSSFYEYKSIFLRNEKGKEIAELKGHDKSVTSANFSISGNYIITSSKDGTVKIWNRNGKEIKTFSFNEPINYANFSPNEQYIYVQLENNIIKICNLNTQEISEPFFAGNSIKFIYFSLNNENLIVGTNDNIRIYDIKHYNEYMKNDEINHLSK